MKALVGIYREDGSLVAWYEPTPGRPVSPATAPMEVWASIDPSAHVRQISVMRTEDLVEGFDSESQEDVAHMEAQVRSLWKTDCWLECDPVGRPRYKLQWVAIEDLSF